MTSDAGQSRRTQPRGRGKRSDSSRATLHPERMWKLFKRAGRIAKALAVLLLLVTVLGLAYLLVPFQVVTPHPTPPPLELVVGCPPPLVSAVAGSGGLPNPVPDMAEMAAVHDQLCAAFGRQRALTGLLLTAAGVLNAAALLEWARIRRRSRRRARRRPTERRHSRTTEHPEAHAEPAVGEPRASDAAPDSDV